MLAGPDIGLPRGAWGPWPSRPGPGRALPFGSAEQHGQAAVQRRRGDADYARQPRPAGDEDVLAAALRGRADEAGYPLRRDRPRPGPDVRGAAAGEERGVGHTEDHVGNP